MSNIFEDERLFANRRKNHIFKDKKPLDHRFLPDKLVHRDDQIRKIAKYWVDVLDDVSAEGERHFITSMVCQQFFHIRRAATMPAGFFHR